MQPKPDGSPDVGPKSRTTSLLEGFVGTDSRAIIQENVYVILGHGWFQESVLLCTILSLGLLLMQAFAYRLIGRAVDHWCQPPSDFRDWSVQQWKNVAIPVLPDGSFSKCTMYSPPVPDGDEERREVPCDRWDYDTAEVDESIVSKWNLVCEHTWLYSISSSVYMLGSLCLVPVAGIMADRMGRRPVMVASATTTLLASMAASSTHAFGAFLLARFFVSAAASATNVLNFIVLYEVTGNEHRALYILLANSVASAVTPALFSLFSLLRPSWRLSHALLVTASATVLLWCYYVHESPVWQLATGRVRQAESTVLQAAKSNGVNMAKARSTFKVLYQQLEKRETASGGATSGSELIIFAASFRRRAVSIFLSWFAVTFAYYGARVGSRFGGLWPLSGHLFKIVLLIATYYSMKKRGERATLFTVLTLLFFCAAFRTVAYQWNLSIAMPASSIMVFGATSAAICVNCGYTAEVFPTAIRSIGFCIAYSVGRVGALLATVIDAYAGDQRVAVINVTIAVLSLLSGLAIQWLPEIFLHQKKNTEQGTLDERQRKEALKECLDRIQGTPKAGKPGKARGHQKRKKGPTSPGTSSAPSAVTSGAASPASTRGPTSAHLSAAPSEVASGAASVVLASSPQRTARSPIQKPSSPLRKAGPILEEKGYPDSSGQKAKSPSEFAATLQKDEAPPSHKSESPLEKTGSPSLSHVSPSQVSSKKKRKRSTRGETTSGVQSN